MKKTKVAIEQKTLVATTDAEVKVFEMIYLHRYTRNQQEGEREYPITIRFSNKKVYNVNRPNIDGFYEILSWAGETGASEHFNACVLPYKWEREKIETLMEEIIRKNELRS